MGACGAPMLSGMTDLHRELERQVAKFLGREDAMLFNSGFGGALGTISGLLRKSDVAILDISLRRMDGIALVRRIREEQIPVEIVFLTICDDKDIFEEALDLGVKGYLLKDCTEAELIRCVMAVASGQHYTAPPMTTFLVDKVRRNERFARETTGLDLLTPQERAVLRRIADGKTSKEIAQEMGIATKTVDAHRANICNKLEIHGPNVLGRFAVRHRTEF